jgi:aryl-alcohol dehydrogenase-like predicted oxidoreductase
MSLGNDHGENSKVLQSAYDNGINFFDTADLYQKGFNEETVGLALKEVRKNVQIATKVGNQLRKDGSGWDWNPTKKYILEAVEKSLLRLQTDYIDLYQLHGGTIDDPMDETIEAFELLKKSGKIRYYGISSIRPNVIREYVKRSGIVSVMMQYSLLDRRPEEECLDLLHKHNVGILARGSLASGLLVNKSAKPYLNYSATEVEKISSAVSQIADTNRTKTEIALQYVMNHKAVSCAVVGIRTMHQLQDILSTDVSHSPTADELNVLRSFSEPNYYTDHR